MIEIDTIEAYVGRKLSKDENGMIEWLNRLDDVTRNNFMGLMESSHRFGYISGQVDNKRK
jgi:hypothetical protein